MTNEIGVGLLGCGTVGTGVVRLLERNRADIEARLGAPLRVKRIVVKDPDRRRDASVPATLLSGDPDAVLDDPEIRIVVEVIGGYEPARSFVLRALAQGKHVVTANKALLARHGAELGEAAERAGADIHYEAAVGGGIPIIRSLRESLASDRIERLVAIINGTSNFVLTAMAERGWTFDDAVKEAQRLGYAEADASLDTAGHDAAQKLSLLVALAFGVRAPSEAISREGIESITPQDMELAHRFGFAIRPLAFARAVGPEVEARVHPALVPRSGLLASVSGVFNAVHIQSEGLGPALLYGQGAGMMPTAVSVVSDVIDAARSVRLGTSGRLPHLSFHDGLVQARTLQPAEASESAWYLRLSVSDVPGVLAQVAGVLGRHGVSIRQLVQSEPNPSAVATLAVLTHSAVEGSLRKALTDIGELEATVEPCHAIRVVDV